MEGKFFGLVHFLYAICWQALGKVANPATGKPERNLDFAQSIIEILETLQEKTKGNLDREEEKALSAVLADLRLNYIDERGKKEPATEKEPAKDEHADKEKKPEEKTGENA